ncbi:hypothetical protein AncyloWKF20_07445 [Ancylobacter sp. WKF20]|uniref:hypothetical protein n=1 Tax=Ancylobacter sp. WKF20 TaxID=3039801 RepID=UPI0024341C48|nr:hypothetical protein [Ancylobacter sp. WKF20]WGD31643.1 hypothetical protein AncyloWKF20_07445 [Ancylobacter sp. WKF20]
MSNKADEKELGGLHKAVAEALTKKIENGEAVAADLAVAVKFLKDNGITASLKSEHVQNLVHTLPFSGEDDAEDSGYRAN